jgi:UDP-N-acetylmuramate dehydrogenase
VTTWDGMVAEGVATRQVELAPLTTYKLGGPTDLFIDADELTVLERCAQALTIEPLPVLVMGRGSNLLVADTGFRGVVIRLGTAFSELAIDADGVVTAGAALSLPRLARAAGSSARGGLEWCVGVPGSVGGAVRQNAGCFGSEVFDVLLDADLITLADGGGRSTRRAADLDLSYRHSNLAPTDVVTSARFFTTAVDSATSAEEMRSVTRWRRDNQPGGTLNAGSVFKNPGDEAAGAIIERLELKGFTRGKVRVSPRHANFVEAEPGATAGDVRALILAVRALVRERAGIELEPEIQFVGFED